MTPELLMLAIDICASATIVTIAILFLLFLIWIIFGVIVIIAEGFFKMLLGSK